MKSNSTSNTSGLKNGVFIVSMIFLLLMNFSCTQDHGIEEIAYGEIMEQVCTLNQHHKYHVLLPESDEISKELPLVIILDAHGNGKMAVQKFQDAVKNIPCILAGSDLIKNNIPEFEKAINDLLTDLKTRYSIDKEQIVIAGFSGGARMAYYYSLNHDVKGVLMCGAGPGRQLPSCPVYSISGMGDFNFSEQYYQPSISALHNRQLTSDFFHGAHEWPEAGLLSDGLLFLLNDAGKIKVLRKERVTELIHSADSLTEAGDALLAWKALEKAGKLSNERQQKKITKSAEVFLENERFKTMISTLESDLIKERNMQQAYSERIFSGDYEWWKKELDLLKTRINGESTDLVRDHYLRIKGYIGIMLYSVVNRMSQTDPTNAQLESIINIYAYAEPENPDPCYFQALHHLMSGEYAKSEVFLNKALELGFSDLNRLKKEFPAEMINRQSI